MDAHTTYLQGHLVEEEKQDVKRERIEKLAKLLIECGGQYYPFTKEHFTEAVQNLSDTVYEKLAERTATVLVGEWGNYAAMCVGHSLHLEVRRYWLRIALEKAKWLVDNE